MKSDKLQDQIWTRPFACLRVRPETAVTPGWNRKYRTTLRLKTRSESSEITRWLLIRLAPVDREGRRKLCAAAFHKQPPLCPWTLNKVKSWMLILVKIVVTSFLFPTSSDLLFYSDGNSLISCSTLSVWSLCVCVCVICGCGCLWCRGWRVRGEISGPHMAVI